jgi:hypothetical protein
MAVEMLELSCLKDFNIVVFHLLSEKVNLRLSQALMMITPMHTLTCGIKEHVKFYVTKEDGN